MYLFAEVGQENLIASLLDFHSNFINWLLLVGILFFLIRKFIPPVIAQRQLSINNELAAAAKTRQDAELALAEQKAQIEQASQAVEKIVVEARQTAKQMSEEVRKQTEQDTADLLKKFEMAAHNERQAAVLEMRNIVARAAITLAEENLQSALTADNKTKIAQEFMGELSRVNQTKLGTEHLKKNSSDKHNSEQPHALAEYQGNNGEMTQRISSFFSDTNLVGS
jgi:F-type H+-transporting ATPase subunit b